MPVRFFISKELNRQQKERLREVGVDFLGLPLIKTIPVEFDPSAVLSFKPDSVVFSSKNGVRFFFERFPCEGLGGAEVIAVGSATAKELEKRGFLPVYPENFSAEGLIELLKDRELKGKRFLIVRPKKARRLLPDFLRERGAEVLELVVYETVPDSGAAQELSRFFGSNVDYAAFTSPSNFKSFLKVFPSGRELLKGVRIIPIGHVTAEAVKKEGFSPLPPPKEYTVDGIINELLKLENFF